MFRRLQFRRLQLHHLGKHLSLWFTIGILIKGQVCLKTCSWPKDRPVEQKAKRRQSHPTRVCIQNGEQNHLQNIWKLGSWHCFTRWRWTRRAQAPSKCGLQKVLKVWNPKTLRRIGSIQKNAGSLLARPRTLCCIMVFKPNLKVTYLSHMIFWRKTIFAISRILQESLLHFHQQDCKVNFGNTPVMHFTFRMLKSSNLPEICCTDSLSACQGGRPPGVYTIGVAMMQRLWNKDEREKSNLPNIWIRVWVCCASQVRP